MITGEVTFTSAGRTSTVCHDPGSSYAGRELSFRQVTAEGFDGGYYVSARLPYVTEDFYYSDRDKDIMVLLSGDVYNSAVLVGEKTPDLNLPKPELIAMLFLQQGPGFAEELNGDFAVFILRPSKREAFLYRDHVGIRPLAYAIEDGSLFFSTDFLGLARSFSDKYHLDTEYLLDTFKNIDYRQTPVKKVKKLQSGHYLRFTGGKVEVARYWDPGRIRMDKSLTHQRMLEELKTLVTDTVAVRCDSRFAAGTHLSGGLDSSIVAALTRERYRQQEVFFGFSWSPATFTGDNPAADERELIRSFCAREDITPVFSDLHASGLAVEAGSSYYGRMYFAENRVVAQAAERGVNLIFSGWGGDDFVSTGDRGIEIDLLRSFRLREFFKRNPVRPFRKFIKYLIIYIIYPYFGVLHPSVRRYLRDIGRYLKKPFRKSDSRSLSYFHFFRSRRQMHMRLLDLYHIQERCESWAINGYRNGIEYRYPLLDKRIIEYILKVPSELLCKTDYFRPLLREISEGILPGEIRFNWSKDDPVLDAHTRQLYKESAVVFIPELKEWKMNKDLHFIDFGLVEQDIARIGASGEGHDAEILFRTLVFIKAVHAFTREFRKEAIRHCG